MKKGKGKKNDYSGHLKTWMGIDEKKIYIICGIFGGIRIRFLVFRFILFVF
jgi:hypothetical protein